MHTDPDRALEMEAAIQGFMTDAILPFREDHGFSNMALDKLLAWIGDWAGMPMRLRWPYSGIAPEQAAGLRSRARRDLPFIFA